MAKSKASRAQIAAFFAAVEAGQVRKVRALLKTGMSPNVRDPHYFKETPLFTAARNGHEDVFLSLVKAGANLHATDDLGGTVLQEAAGGNGTLGMVQAVLADGVQSADRLADAFLFACDEGRTDIAEALLAAGADVNQASADGDTPLLAAVQANHPKIVAMLLRAGARPDVRVPRDEWGDNKHFQKTALELAVAEGFTKVAEQLRKASAATPGAAPPNRSRSRTRQTPAKE